MLKEIEQKISNLNSQISEFIKENLSPADQIVKKQLEETRDALIKHGFENLSPVDRVYLARHPQRPVAKQYLDALFTDFFIQRGDRLCKEDQSILGGVALFNGTPVTVIAQCKGKNLDENLKYNFGMPNPEGYRKVQRIALQAEKFGRPIITFIDTPGAYPGIEAEERGQGEAIARCLSLFSSLTVPVIAVVIGEGGSGGALAMGVANTIIMLENSVYSILSPEGFATILWKDSSRASEACDIMKLTAEDLYNFGIADYVVKEGVGGAHENTPMVMEQLSSLLQSELNRLKKLDKAALAEHRYQKFRQMGKCVSIKEKR